MDARRRFATRLLLISGVSLIAAPSLRADEVKPPSADAVAAQVDSLFRKSPADQKQASKSVSDEQFLRRVSLDLTGKLPTPEEVAKFVADPATDKRPRLIDRLLQSEAYAVNWGRYWRDVVTYQTPASGNYLRWQLFDKWWTEQLRTNRPWDQVATALVTATGINDESAPVNYLTAMYGNPVEIAAVTSRVFLGVQIQCAQCHDAKLEPFKREQFHEFAAFFGRARIIQHKDVTGRGTPYAIEGRSEGQYRMTDKRKPDRLIDMQPRFLTGETVSIEANDQERRTALARFMTSPKNPWFARAYVNRIWTGLMGWGFYPTLADLGSDQPPQCEEVLDLLAKEWIASGYDVRWLFRTITHTQAYQSQLAAPPSEDQTVATAAVCPQRLRPEQLFEALQKALGFDEHDKSIPAPAPSSSPAVQRHSGLRNMVYQAFKVSPSLPFNEVLGTIPQALLMMNSALIHSYTSSTGKTILAQMLEQGKSDDEIVAALYGKVLVRKPTGEEQAVCRRYMKKVADRKEALEDILWSLVNSTEFLIKKQAVMSTPYGTWDAVRVGPRGLVSRRSFLRCAAGGVGALALRERIAAHAAELRQQGKACILLWMAGGPSQFETLDPKPGAETQGPTRAISTAVPDIRIAEHWTHMAQVMKELAVIRSMTSREGNHGRATYLLHTSYPPSGGIVHPGIGSIVSSELGRPESDLPNFVAVSGASIGASFLGVRHAPFIVTDPNRPPDNLATPVSGDRLGRRLGLLKDLEAPLARTAAAGLVKDHQTLYDQTSQMVLSPRTRAFDLDREADRVREAYGRSAFGQGCLMARRLVESGVPFVEVQSSGWDTHGNELASLKKLIPPVDQATAALIADLKERGLLERTLVIWMGEFGRMPRINLTAGRDHYPHAFNVAMAGLGVKGGQVIGATDKLGVEVVERPVSVQDLFCTFYKALGIDPRKENQSNVNRPLKIVEEGEAVAEVF